MLVDGVGHWVRQGATPELFLLSNEAPELARIRGIPHGIDLRSPSRPPDILGGDDLLIKVEEMREATGYRLPVSVKLGAGWVSDDVKIAVKDGFDFIELDGERAANLISDSIRPRLLPDLEIVRYRNVQLLAVRVHPSPARPHFIARAGLEAGAYVRVGSTNRQADAELVAEMQRFAGGLSFDESPMPALDSEALDFRVASELFAPVRKLTRRNLESLRLLTSHQGRQVPTVGAVLLFGRERLDHFPDAWIQAGRFDGTDKATILDHAELKMPLVQAIEEAIAFVEKHSLHGAEIGRLRRREQWSLPPAAVREAIVNAVVHSDYSQQGAPIRVAIFDDRLEVESRGLLPFGLTVDDLPLGVSKLRNRVIGRVLHELALVEQWGSGVPRMRVKRR